MNEPYWFLMCMKQRSIRIPRRRQYLKARGISVRMSKADKKEVLWLWRMANAI